MGLAAELLKIVPSGTIHRQTILALKGAPFSQHLVRCSSGLDSLHGVVRFANYYIKSLVLGLCQALEVPDDGVVKATFRVRSN